MTTISSTTSSLIDDPDRVTPKVSCVAFDATKDAIKIINSGASPTNICDYYSATKNTYTGDLSFIAAPSLI
jgi:hypothetical protein